jgi:predicted AAA+ superfamily ATPase
VAIPLRRRARERVGQFLILGSASPELLQQRSESLAGRISYLELPPINLLELPEEASHYRTRSGSELDLVLEDPGSTITAVEIKRTLSPKITRGFTEAMNHLKASRGFFIIPEGAAFPLSENVTAISLAEYLGKGDERSWK